MRERPFWLQSILRAWQRRPIVWLSGPRRAGKTVLARMVPDALYLNCDLPSVARRLEDPEVLYRSLPPGATVVLDEVHRLPDPSAALKIAADAFPGMRVLATGSSTLAATRKFRDTLTGRKAALYLAPVLWNECLGAFGPPDLDRRLARGGLPEPLLAPAHEPEFYAEWLDSYYARDIAELFGVRNRAGFLTLLRLLLRQSGGMADLTGLASACGLARPTVAAHIEAMSVAHAVYPVRPFHGGGRSEIVRQPKLYAFDTGFVAYANGWGDLTDESRGLLWEHLVLDALRAAPGVGDVLTWRTKGGCEVDFVVPLPGGRVDAVECKSTPASLNARCLHRFRELYPVGRNWLVCPYETEPWVREVGGLRVDVVSTPRLAEAFGGADGRPGGE